MSYTTAVRAGDTVTAALWPAPGLAWQAVVVELRPTGEAELDTGYVLPLDEVCRVETGESWCPVKGYEGRYRLSSHGKIVSLRYLGTQRHRLLKPSGAHRYPSVSLGKGPGHPPKQIGLNRLVAQHFLPPPAEPRLNILMPVDGNHLNVQATNLKWVDKQEMANAEVLKYLHCCGERHPYHKLSSDDVAAIRKLLAQGNRRSVIARQFAVSGPTISHIALGRTRRVA